MRASDVMTTDGCFGAARFARQRDARVALRSDVSDLSVDDESENLVGIVTGAGLVSTEAYDGCRRRAVALAADVLSAQKRLWMMLGVR